MEHRQLAVKAATLTEQGWFSAIAAAYTVDRQGERIEPGAFTKTIARWQGSGKNIPLHWNHKADADHIIGAIDPNALEEREDGLYVEGQLDIEESGLAREAWRSVKAGAVGLSFGFLVLADHEEKDARVLDELDLFEISLTPAPANADTRVLSHKSVSPSPDGLRRELDRLMSSEPTRKPAGRKRLDPIRIAEFDV